MAGKFLIKFLKYLLAIAIITVVFTPINQPAFAAQCTFSVNTTTPSIGSSNPLIITITANSGQKYNATIPDPTAPSGAPLVNQEVTASGTSATITIVFPDSAARVAGQTLKLSVREVASFIDCPATSGGLTINIIIQPGGALSLSITTDPASPITESITTIKSLTIGGLEPNKTYQLQLSRPPWSGDFLGINGNNDWKTNSGTTITASNICQNGNANRTDCTTPFENGTYKITVKEGLGTKGFAQFIVSRSFVSGKNPCIGGKCVTGIGDIPTNPTAFVGRILTIAISLAGGIALIIMVIGSVKVLMSAGDQQKLNNGRDMIIAAVAGLLFLIFSVLILRFLGNELLGLNIPAS